MSPHKASYRSREIFKTMTYVLFLLPGQVSLHLIATLVKFRNACIHTNIVKFCFVFSSRGKNNKRATTKKSINLPTCQ